MLRMIFGVNYRQRNPVEKNLIKHWTNAEQILILSYESLSDLIEDLNVL